MPLDSYENLLSSLFMNRLPQELRLIVSRDVGEAEWQIDDILRENSVQEREHSCHHMVNHTVWGYLKP